MYVVFIQKCDHFSILSPSLSLSLSPCLCVAVYLYPSLTGSVSISAKVIPSGHYYFGSLLLAADSHGWHALRFYAQVNLYEKQ